MLKITKECMKSAISFRVAKQNQRHFWTMSIAKKTKLMMNNFFVKSLALPTAISKAFSSVPLLPLLELYSSNRGSIMSNQI